MNNDNNFNIENKFINYGTSKKKKNKKIILILLLILLLGILGYLVYANKIAKANNKQGNSDYEEYDPNYEISNSNSNNNSNSNIASNIISNSNVTTDNTSNITSSINSNINITSNIITSNSNIRSNQTTSNSTSKTVAVTGIKLNKASVSMVEGTSTTISATITPSNATNKTVIWSSSNTGVATVSNGKITAKKEGTTTITATTKDGNKKATCKVTVTKKQIAVTGGYWLINTPTIYVGSKFDFGGKYVIVPNDATDQSIKWSVSNTSIISINGSVIKGLKSGDAVVYGKLSNGDTISRAIHVRNNPSNYAINMNRIGYGHGGSTAYIYSIEVTKNGTKITNFKSLTYNGYKITPSNTANICMNTGCSIDTSVHYGTLYDENGYLVGQVRINYNF